MAFKASYHNEDFPKGMEFELPGFGMVANGGSSEELSDEAEIRFISANGMGVREYFKNSTLIKLSGSSDVITKDYLPKEVSDSVDIKNATEMERATLREGVLLSEMAARGESVEGNPLDFLPKESKPKKQDDKKGGDQ